MLVHLYLYSRLCYLSYLSCIHVSIFVIKLMVVMEKVDQQRATKNFKSEARTDFSECWLVSLAY